MQWRHHRSLCSLLLASAIMLAVAPAIAADVTPERLVNPEPGNCLMNHRTYDGQRFSPLLLFSMRDRYRASSVLQNATTNSV